MYEVVPGRLNGRSGFLRRREEGVAIACQEGVHLADQSLHLAIAAACSVVNCHLPPRHLIQHCLKDSKTDMEHTRHKGLAENRETSSS